MKKLTFAFVTLVTAFFLLNAVTLHAQDVVLSDEFNSGDGLWTGGWIDAGSTSVTVSIDTTDKLSGQKSYKLAIVNGGADMYRIQRNANLPLLPGYIYTLSFMAVADSNATINALFEISGDPYTKRLNEMAQVTATPQTFTFSMTSAEDVPTNQVKLHFGSHVNDGRTIWVDNIIVTRALDLSAVSKWGKTSLGTAWPIDTVSVAGNAGIGNGTAKPTGWSTIRGGFDTLTATTTQAVVVSGQMELVGGGGASAYTWLRYALTFQDSVTLNYQGTDTAVWVSPKKNYGYSFQPRTGTGTMSNGAGGAGTVWTVSNGNWTSTWSNGGKGPLSAVKQAPRNAVAVAGTYNWAISVKSVNDTLNEIKWYLVEATNKYWFGGTIIDTATSKKFNGVNFGFNSDGEATKVNFTGVKAKLGASITVPEAPWQAYYVDQWGKTSLGKAWPIIWQDTTGGQAGTIVGDAGIGNGSRPTGWSTIRGGFGDPITITTDKAIIVSGQMEFVGGGGASAYTWLRYALTFQDSLKLNYRGTDTAEWVTSSPVGTPLLKNYGYSFQPRTGTGTMSNGAGGAGTVWTVSNGNWTSTWSNGGKGPLSAIKQAPRNAVAVAGTYNWAISVKSVNDTLNEIRWSLVEATNKYWFGGTIIDTATIKKFNGINFGFNNDIEATQVNLIAVKVDFGTPITVPEAPWQAYYVDQWGKTAQGKAWPIIWQDTTGGQTGTIVGDAGIGNGSRPTGWATIRGGFGDPVTITTSKAIIVSGQMELVGGGGASAYTWLRYALTYQDSAALNYRGTDTAEWISTSNPATKHYGYSFQPRTGTGTMSNGAGGAGTVWTVVNGSWASTWSNGGKGPLSAVKQAPRNAVAVAGTYDWAISVREVTASTNEIKWYMIEADNKYWFGGTIIDTATIKKFNGVNFGFNTDLEATQVNLYAVKVDLGTPITVPDAPWEAYYVDQWGIYGSRYGGWTFQADPERLVGNAGIGGTAANTDWAAVRAGFDPFTLSATRRLLVTGKVEFVGGGFEANNLSFGVFNSGNPGTLVIDSAIATLPDSTRWSGAEDSNSGYLMVPASGTVAPAVWANSKPGTFGTVSNDVWLNNGNGSALGHELQTPANAVAGAGVYDFAISVTPVADGKNEIRYKLQKGTSYFISEGTTDIGPVATTFNSIIFALNTSTSTTAMKFTDVQVDTGIVSGATMTAVENPESTLPTVYALNQNYPNPFNPSTTIQYDLPLTSHVTLTIYDILGRAVTQLVDQKQTASKYTVQWNASSLSSGVYFYRINAKSEDGSKTFTSVKKLLLMK